MGVSALYSSIINRIKTASQFGFVHIWNNQLEQLENGETYVFPFPCVFVEIITPAAYSPLGLGYSVGDLIIRIHLGHEEYDAGNGNYEENTNVFTYRDILVGLLNNYQPTGCSSLMKSAEAQDYVHTNVYHYTIEFKAAFIDNSGSFDVQIPTEPGEITEITPGIVVDRVNLYDKFDATFDQTFQFYE